MSCPDFPDVSSRNNHLRLYRVRFTFSLHEYLIVNTHFLYDPVSDDDSASTFVCASDDDYNNDDDNDDDNDDNDHGDDDVDEDFHFADY